MNVVAVVIAVIIVALIVVALSIRVVRADEALPFVAITIRASVVRADDGIAPADGIGALLRYAPTGVLGGSGAPSRSIAL